MPLLYRSKNKSVIQQIVVENLIHRVFIDGTLVLGFCLYPINPSRFSNQYRTGADRCTPTLPR